MVLTGEDYNGLEMKKLPFFLSCVFRAVRSPFKQKEI